MERQRVHFHIDGREVSYKPTAFRRWVVDLVVLWYKRFWGYGSFLTFCNAVEIDYASHS